MSRKGHPDNCRKYTFYILPQNYFDFNNNGTSAKRNSDDDFSVSLTPTQAPVKTVKSRRERLADYANNR